VIVVDAPVIGSESLREQIGIQRTGAKRVLAHGNRFVGLVAVAYLNGRRALSRVPHAGIIASTANRDRRILRQFAIQAVGGVDRRGIGG
jgi:hypothetical protein